MFWVLFLLFIACELGERQVLSFQFVIWLTILIIARFSAKGWVMNLWKWMMFLLSVSTGINSLWKLGALYQLLRYVYNNQFVSIALGKKLDALVRFSKKYVQIKMIQIIVDSIQIVHASIYQIINTGYSYFMVLRGFWTFLSDSFDVERKVFYKVNSTSFPTYIEWISIDVIKK